MRNREIKRVMVVGAGVMGEGIAQNFAQAGLSVNLVELDKEILERCLAQIKYNIDIFIEYGLIAEKPETIMSRICPIQSNSIAEAVKDCDFVVEAIPEIPEIKRELFSQIMSVREDITISSNTSSLNITTLADGLRNPERIIGLHYFNPAHIIPLVEIHRGELTSDDVFEETKKLMQRVGKKPVLVRKEVPGNIVNRITGAIEREIDYLLDEGIVSPEDLDTAVKASIGFRFASVGPMEVEDMIGLDTAMRVSQRIFPALSNASEPSPELVKKVERGELGIKSGNGWYDYSNKPRSEVLEEKNLRLIEQLVLFNKRESN